MAKAEEIQCQGLTKKRTQCTRKAPVSQRYRGKVYCWQHIKEAKGGESDSDDRDFIVDDDEEYEDDFLESEGGSDHQKHEVVTKPKSSRRPQTPRKKTPSKPSNASPSTSSSSHQSPRPLVHHNRPNSSGKPLSGRPLSGKPLRKISSTEELFDSFGRMNLVNDIPPEPAVVGKKKEYSLFGGRVKVTKDTTGQGAHLNVALNLKNKEERLRHKLFHRFSSSSDYDPDAGPVAPDPKTYNGTSVPLTLPQTTADYFNWIPKHVLPETAQKLLREILVPVSDRDVPGYIYMCWVTPDVPGHNKPSRNWASRLIPSFRVEGGQTILPDGSKVSTAEVMKAAGVPPQTVEDNSGATKDCIILKIGRAVNVEQRMKQWKDQCAHTLTLMRYYPYFSGQPLPDVFSDEPTTARSGAVDNSKVPRDKIIPHCHKVEHLIHIELDELRVRYQKPCNHCGQKHQEWFEIPAEASKIRMVHECISKWTRWSQMMAEEMEKSGGATTFTSGLLLHVLSPAFADDHNQPDTSPTTSPHSYESCEVMSHVPGFGEAAV
ncbi:hypothetical protein KEM54_004365 [Ascosphaera aggregata]|nr:hypothetical protein KEM54_004365 [Ascosphaera aggregata]